MNLFLQLLFLQSLPLWYTFQVTGFVAALRMFFTYGLESRTQITHPAPSNQEKEFRIMSKSSFDEPKKVEHSPYRPPHLRKKDTSYMRQKKSRNSQSSSDHESSTVDFTSSDSDYSDSDGSVKESETVWHSKVRVTAIVCIQVSSQILNSPHDAWVIQGVLFFPSLNQMAIAAYKNQWNPPLILLVEPTSKPPPSWREQGIVLGIAHVNMNLWRSLRWSLYLGWHVWVTFSDAGFCHKYSLFEIMPKMRTYSGQPS